MYVYHRICGTVLSELPDPEPYTQLAPCLAVENGDEEQDTRSENVGLDRKFPCPEVSTHNLTEEADNGNSVVSWHVFARQ